MTLDTQKYIELCQNTERRIRRDLAVASTVLIVGSLSLMGYGLMYENKQATMNGGLYALGTTVAAGYILSGRKKQ